MSCSDCLQDIMRQVVLVLDSRDKKVGWIHQRSGDSGFLVGAKETMNAIDSEGIIARAPCLSIIKVHCACARAGRFSRAT